MTKFGEKKLIRNLELFKREIYYEYFFFKVFLKSCFESYELSSFYENL